jgi:hypothetical protein
MWPFTISSQPPYKQKLYGQRFNDYNPSADRYQQRFPNDSNSMRFSNYIEPPGRSNANATLQQLLQGLAPTAPSAPPAAAATLPAVLPPALPGPLNHPITA